MLVGALNRPRSSICLRRRRAQRCLGYSWIMRDHASRVTGPARRLHAGPLRTMHLSSISGYRSTMETALYARQCDMSTWSSYLVLGPRPHKRLPIDRLAYAATAESLGRAYQLAPHAALFRGQ